MTTPADDAGQLLTAMFTAWRDDIDAEPVPDMVAAAQRSDHAPTHDLAGL